MDGPQAGPVDDCNAAATSDAVLDALAQQITTLGESAARLFVIGAGRLITETLYCGDPSAWRARSHKDESLRRLAARPGLKVSATTLYRALAAYELLTRAGSLSKWPTLSVSHFRAVAGLTFGDQCALLDRAEEHTWSVAQLSREARTICRGSKAATELAMPARCEAWWQKLVKLRAIASWPLVGEPEPSDRPRILAAISELEAFCMSIRNRLQVND